MRRISSTKGAAALAGAGLLWIAGGSAALGQVYLDQVDPLASSRKERAGGATDAARRAQESLALLPKTTGAAVANGLAAVQARPDAASATVMQAGAGNRGDLEMSGAGNVFTALQEGSRNAFAGRQIGDSNTADLRLTGADNAATVSQVGDGNAAGVRAIGSRNVVTTEQSGTNLRVDVLTVGNGKTIGIRQSR